MRRLHKVFLSLLFLVDIFLVGSIGYSQFPGEVVVQAEQKNGATKDYRKEKEKTFWQKAFDDPVAVFTGVLTAFTGVLAWSTYFLWRATRDVVDGAERASAQQILDTKTALAISKESADAARDSVNVARETMIIARRPWIRADAAIGGPLFFNDNGLNITIAVRLLNVGPTPAIYTSISLKDYILMRSDYARPSANKIGPDWLAAQKTFSDENMRETPFDRGYTVFPSMPTERLHVVIDPEFRIPANGDLSSVPFADEAFIILIIGSVAYKFAFHEDVHRTGFIYEVSVNDPNNRTITPRAEEIPKEKLSLRKVDDGYTD
jgi:hypothetical protein